MFNIVLKHSLIIKAITPEVKKVTASITNMISFSIVSITSCAQNL